MCNSLPTISFCLASIPPANESARHQTLFIVRCKQHATRRLCSVRDRSAEERRIVIVSRLPQRQKHRSNNKQKQVLLTLRKVERCAYFCSQHLLYTKSTGQHPHQTKRSGIQRNTPVEKEHKYQRRKTRICHTPSKNFTPKTHTQIQPYKLESTRQNSLFDVMRLCLCLFTRHTCPSGAVRSGFPHPQTVRQHVCMCIDGNPSRVKPQNPEDSGKHTRPLFNNELQTVFCVCKITPCRFQQICADTHPNNTGIHFKHIILFMFVTAKTKTLKNMRM